MRDELSFLLLIASVFVAAKAIPLLSNDCSGESVWAERGRTQPRAASGCSWWAAGQITVWRSAVSIGTAFKWRLWDRHTLLAYQPFSELIFLKEAKIGLPALGATQSDTSINWTYILKQFEKWYMSIMVLYKQVFIVCLAVAICRRRSLWAKSTVIHIHLEQISNWEKENYVSCFPLICKNTMCIST